METPQEKVQYDYDDEKNVSGILEDETKDISQLLPPLEFPTWTEKEKEIIAKFRESVKEHIIEVEGHYFHTDFYLSRYCFYSNIIRKYIIMMIFLLLSLLLL